MGRVPKPLPSVTELFAHHFGIDADPKIATPIDQPSLPGLEAEAVAERIAAKHAAPEPTTQAPRLGGGEPDEVLLEKKRPRRVVVIER